MNTFDEHNIIITLLIIIIVWLFYLTFIKEEPRPIQVLALEGVGDLSDEAIQSIAAIYNKDNLTVSNLTVTGTVTNKGMTDKVNSLQSQIRTKQPTGNYVKYGDQFKINNIWDGWKTYLDTCTYSSCGGNKTINVNSTYGNRSTSNKWRLVKS